MNSRRFGRILILILALSNVDLLLGNTFEHIRQQRKTRINLLTILGNSADAAKSSGRFRLHQVLFITTLHPIDLFLQQCFPIFVELLLRGNPVQFRLPQTSRKTVTMPVRTY